MSSHNTLQIVTTNIGGNRHSRETPLNPPRIAHEVREILPIDPSIPTIIAAQEVSTVWYQDRQPLNTGTLLAMELGFDFRSYFAAEIDSLTHAHRRAWNNITYEGAIRASEGNGIITNLSLVAWPWSVSLLNHPGFGNLSPLSTTISRATLYTSGNRDTQPRGVLVASLDSPFGPIFFMATHLATFHNDIERKDPTQSGGLPASGERLHQVQEIISVVQQIRLFEETAKQDARPILLAGDFNAQPSSIEMQTLGRTFQLLKPRSGNGDLSTHVKHQIQIDHIFLSDPLRILGEAADCFIHHDARIAQVTDHLPVVAVFHRS